jgi:hypothetical protein
MNDTLAGMASINIVFRNVDKLMNGFGTYALFWSVVRIMRSSDVTSGRQPSSVREALTCRGQCLMTVAGTGPDVSLDFRRIDGRHRIFA